MGRLVHVYPSMRHEDTDESGWTDMSAPPGDPNPFTEEPRVKGHPNFRTCGHRKLPHPSWSGQGFRRLDQPRLQLFLQSIGVAPDVDRDRVMKEAVQDGCGDHPVAEDLPQLPKLWLLVKIIGPRS